MVASLERFSVDQQYTIDQSGRTAFAGWQLTAKSRVHAEARLRSVGVLRGAIFQDVDGSTPDLTMRLDSIGINRVNVEGLPGDASWYEAIAEYKPITNSTKQKGVEIIVDGPAVWTTEGALNSVPVDTDRYGNPLVNTALVPIKGVTMPEPAEFQIAEWIKSNTNYFAAVRQSREFRGFTNQRSWKGADKREVLCHGLTPEALENRAFTGSGLVKFTGRFEFVNTRRLNGKVVRPAPGKKFTTAPAAVPGFTSTFLSAGTIERNPDFRVQRTDDFDPSVHLEHRHIMVMDSQGRAVPASEPTLLGVTGLKTSTEPVSIAYELIDEVDFNRLRI